MKKQLVTLLLLSSILLTSCNTKNPPTVTTPEVTTDTTTQTTVTDTSSMEETTSNPFITYPTYEYKELTYLDPSSLSPIDSPYIAEALQSRNGGLAIVARVYNAENYPVFVDGASLSVDYGKNKTSGAVQITSFYIMPKQTGFVVLKASRADGKLDPDKVDYTFSVRTLRAQKKPKQYTIVNSSATLEYEGNSVNSISFVIELPPDLDTRLLQANITFFNKEGRAVDAFTKKAMETDGKLSFTYIPQAGTLSQSDIHSYAITLTSQCNE